MSPRRLNYPSTGDFAGEMVLRLACVTVGFIAFVIGSTVIHSYYAPIGSNGMDQHAGLFIAAAIGVIVGLAAMLLGIFHRPLVRFVKGLFPDEVVIEGCELSEELIICGPKERHLDLNL